MKKFTLPGESRSSQTKQTQQSRLWDIPKQDIVPDGGEAVPNGVQPERPEISYDWANAIIKENQTAIDNAKAARDLSHDVDQIIKIVVSSILSPKDLNKPQISVKGNDDAPPIFISTIKDYVVNDLKLNDKLQAIVTEALYTHGSCSYMHIPSTAIADMINENTVSLEGDTLTYNADHAELEPLGIIKSSHIRLDEVIALESDLVVNGAITSEELRGYPELEITDNFTELLKPVIGEGIDRRNEAKILQDKFQFESYTQDYLPHDDLYFDRETLEKPRVNLSVTANEVKTNRLRPIELKIPHGAIFTVHAPEDVTDHYGYFIVFDKNGSPINERNGKSAFDSLLKRLKKSSEPDETYVKAVGVAQAPEDATEKREFMKPLVDAYKNHVENTLIDSFNHNGKEGNIQVSAPEAIYKIMMARQMANQKTRLVYVPKSMLTYIAFNYNDYGIGESLLEKTKAFASLRAILISANAIASVKNAVVAKRLEITLDEHDQDPAGTVESYITGYANMQSNALPVGLLKMSDIIDALQKSAINVEISGGSYLPESKLAVNYDQNVSPPIDEKTLDRVNKIFYAGLWVTPDIMERAQSGETATSIVSTDLLQTKRVTDAQATLEKHLKHYVLTELSCGGPLLDSLKVIYADYTGDVTFGEMIRSVEILLPSPTQAIVTNHHNAYEAYSSFVDDVIEIYITEDFYSDLLESAEGDYIARSIDNLKMSLASAIKRNYLRNQNMLPEIDKMLSGTSGNATNLIKNHNKTVLNIVGEVYKGSLRVEDKLVSSIEKILTKMNEKSGKGEQYADGPIDGSPVRRGGAKDVPDDVSNPEGDDDGVIAPNDNVEPVIDPTNKEINDTDNDKDSGLFDDS